MDSVVQLQGIIGIVQQHRTATLNNDFRTRMKVIVPSRNMRKRKTLTDGTTQLDGSVQAVKKRRNKMLRRISQK